MLKYLVGAVALIAVLGAAVYFLMMPKSPAPEPPQSQPVQAGGMATSTYATTTYSIIYPSTYVKDETYAYDQFGPNKLIHGVKFTIPESMATGTTLAPDTNIAVEQLPRAKNCTADIYIRQDVEAAEVMDNGMQYSVATTSGAAAGNLYEEIVYAIPGSSPCTAIRYFIHSTNIGNYTPGTVQEFDRAKLISDFDTIRGTLTVLSAPASIPTEPTSTTP